MPETTSAPALEAITPHIASTAAAVVLRVMVQCLSHP
jgi:hypothetical protein